MTEWITKEEAAEQLQASTRTIERHISAGRIETRKEPREGKIPEVLCRSKDVDRLKPEAFLMPELATRPTAATATATTPATPQLSESQALTLAALKALATALATITTRPAEAVSKIDRPWLSVDEAAAKSGLSRRLIRKLIGAGDIVAVKDGRAWKVLQESLLKWKPANTGRQTIAANS
jgi:excisionase family DNA binding protein